MQHPTHRYPIHLCLIGQLWLSSLYPPVLLSQEVPDDESTKPLGAASSLAESLQPRATVWLARGVRLQRAAERGAVTVAMIDSEIEVPVLRREGDWMQIRYGSIKGWVNPLAQMNSALTPREESSPDPRRLKRALELFAIPVSVRPLGPFDLYTDIRDEKLLRRLAGVAIHLSAAFSSRFGIDPGVEADEAVIIFAKQADYRAFESDDARLEALGSHGHAGGGMASLYADQHSVEEIVALLVHELVHLFNRRVFTSPPPPWLEEGMATDLAYCQIGRDGRIELESLRGKSKVIDQPLAMAGGWKNVHKEIRLAGPKAAFSLLKQSLERQEPVRLESLARLTWDDFVDPVDRPMRYVVSAFLVRYFLDRHDSQIAQRFKQYLRSLSTSEALESSEILQYLDSDWQEVEHGFGAWIARHRLAL